jgi:hypothetical protein
MPKNNKFIFSCLLMDNVHPLVHTRRSVRVQVQQAERSKMRGAARVEHPATKLFTVTTVFYPARVPNAARNFARN